MMYQVKIKPKALKDCKSIEKKILKQVFDRIEKLSNDLHGDVKKLTNFTPEYRLRVGDYRILFEIENDTVFIYRIIHRREVYR